MARYFTSRKFQVREMSSAHELLASRMPTYGCNFAENLCRPVCPFPSRANISTKDFVSRRMRVPSFARPCSLFTAICNLSVLPDTGISHPPQAFSFKRFYDSFAYRHERPNEMLSLIQEFAGTFEMLLSYEKVRTRYSGSTCECSFREERSEDTKQGHPVEA